MKNLGLTLGTFALLPQVALAHVGDHGGSAFMSGMMHPVGGADHVLAMVAVGLSARGAARALGAGTAIAGLALAFA